MKEKEWYEYLGKSDLDSFYDTIPLLNDIVIYGITYNLSRDRISIEIGFNQEVDNKPPSWKVYNRHFVKCQLDFLNISGFELTKNINNATEDDLIDIEQMDNEMFSIMSKGKQNFKFFAESYRVDDVTWDFYSEYPIHYID